MKQFRPTDLFAFTNEFQPMGCNAQGVLHIFGNV